MPPLIVDDHAHRHASMELTSEEIEITVPTMGRGFIEITQLIENWITDIKATGGLLTLFIRHTSASLTIQENADPTVLLDLEDALDRLAPESHPYRHSQEGPDDMPAHIKSLLTATSLSIPVINNKSALGTWQGVYLIEHRAHAHDRKIVLQYLGSSGTDQKRS